MPGRHEVQDGIAYSWIPKTNSALVLSSFELGAGQVIVGYTWLAAWPKKFEIQMLVPGGMVARRGGLTWRYAINLINRVQEEDPVAAWTALLKLVKGGSMK